MKTKKSENKEKISALTEDLDFFKSYARDLFSFLPLPACSINSTGIILEANSCFEKVSGCQAEEIVGRPIEDFFNKQEFEEIIKETIKNGFIKAKESNFIAKDNLNISISLFTFLRRNKKGEKVGYFFGFFDLAEIKEKEKGLKETQAALLNMLEDTEKSQKEIEEEKNKTLSIINNFVDGILVFDKDNKLLLINPRAEKILKTEEKKVIGKSVSEIAEIPSFNSLIDLLGIEIKEISRKELEIEENLIIEVSTVLMLSEDKRTGSLVILHDITRGKIIERIKTEFVSLAAHQLRTPLSAIKWTLKMLMEGDLGKISQNQKEFVEKTYQSNERMINLINDLLNITRIEEGRYLFKPTLTDFENIVDSIIEISQEEMSKRNINLDFKRPKEKLPKVIIDVEKIKLVVQNLFDNAIKYSPPRGKITVLVQLVKFYDKNKKEIIFSIEDTGVGIPKNQQHRVFGKFFRAANVLRMDTEGTGLGLFISKNIIEAHEGRMWFESEEGSGSTFYFTLPVKEE